MYYLIKARKLLVDIKMSVGRIGEFEVSSGNWSTYVERVNMYFIANEIKAELQLPTLIAIMGEEAYDLLSNLTSPMKPADMKYAEVIKIMSEHIEPKPSFMAERYRLRQRRQGDKETVAQYLTDLKKLAKHCEFGSTLEENLRDQFTCGLRNDTIRQRLFAEVRLSYNRAVQLALSLEAAEKDAAMVERPSVSERGDAGERPEAVHALASWQPRGGKGVNKLICAVCGKLGHRDVQCPYKDFQCNKCGNVGHLKRVCPARMASGDGGSARGSGGGARGSSNSGGGGARRSGTGGRRGTWRPRRAMHHVQAEEAEAPEDDGNTTASDVEEDLYHLCLNGYKPVSISLCVDNKVIPMEVDTGSAVSCISRNTYNKYFKHREIEPFDLVLKFYDGSRVRPLGVIRPEVKYENRSKHLELFIIDGGTTSLLGRQWLTELGVQIPIFHNVSVNGELCTLIDRYKELFSGGLGRFNGGKATLRVREGATPVFCRARPLPYALRDRVEAELDEMLRCGVIEPVDTSEWATPLVPVRKADGGLRICADYKVTLNPALLIDRYPLPKIDDLLVRLNGARVFSKIDLTQAYNQVELDDSKEYTVINTHKGLFRYNRLVYGLSSSPGIFQRIMSNLLKDLPQVEVFLDDIIIGSVDIKSHLETLEKVLERLRSHGMKLKESKCSFLLEEVQYLGYIISKDGIKVDPTKIEGILKIPRPLNITELRSFLGVVNFYARFVPNLSTILSPLYDLLRKGTVWKWNERRERAFKSIKNLLVSAEVLSHYDPNKQLILTTDASSRGISGVLTQPGSSAGADGARERPVAYVSRSLNEAERNYSQIDKEALSIIFSLEKLHQFLYGRQFLLRTDHKPLVTIFGPKQGIPAMVASRLQRWAIKLSAYTYDIEYIRTDVNGADGLSRLPVPVKNADSLDGPPPEQTYLHFAHNELLLDYHDVKKETQRDPTLSRVLGYIRSSWPSDVELRNLQPYFNRRLELYEELGCVMWGHRVVIPEGCRDRVLSVVHESHMGIVKTKAFARSYVWWPGIDEAVERACRECGVCAAEAEAPARHAPSPWAWPARQWARVHLDFLGPLFGITYLVMIDARTKWLEVFPVPSTSANSTIEKLGEVNARWGFPRQIVSDNGPPFTSEQFSSFLTKHRIEHIHSAPYHPASNGAAENAVKTIKQVIKKAVRQKQNVNLALSNFLLHYRNTPHCTTGESPASLMISRQVRTQLDVLRPDCEDKVRKIQRKQADIRIGANRVLQSGDKIWIRQYRGDAKWLPGHIIQRAGTTDYTVRDNLNRESHRHIDQLRRRSSVLTCPGDPSALQVPQPEDHTDGTAQAIRDNTCTPQRGPQGRPSTRSEASPAPHLTPGTSWSPRAADARDRTPHASPRSDCSEDLFLSPTTTPTPPPKPPQLPRPVRECRLKNPPTYKY